MNIAIRQFAVACAAALMLLAGVKLTIAQAVGPQLAGPVPDYEELTRGPLHEAFAEQVNLNPQPGVIVPEAPPEPIKEIPPDVRPADERAIWVDGYWAYDDVDKEFLWVSGGWRIAPDGQRWVPGYWTKTDAGFQWIGGFWTAADRAEVTYLPQPPATLEEGPTSTAPGAGYFWSPGCWLYVGGRYAWRPGHWAVANPNYAWIPPYYRWTPRGYVLCGGYWDGALNARGCLFAPVLFHRPVYAVSSWYYTPRVVVDFGPLYLHLWVRPSCSHYYFGDWYGDAYASAGFFAWDDYYDHRHCYDPLFTFNVVRYRSRGIDFHDRIHGWHRWYHDHQDDRPRHTYRQQRTYEDEYKGKHKGAEGVKFAKLGRSFDEAVKSQHGKFASLDAERRRRWEDERTLAGKLRQQRASAEKATGAFGGSRTHASDDQRISRATRGVDKSKLPKFKLEPDRSIGKPKDNSGRQNLRPPFSAAAGGQHDGARFQPRDGHSPTTQPGRVDFGQRVRESTRNSFDNKSDAARSKAKSPAKTDANRNNSPFRSPSSAQRSGIRFPSSSGSAPSVPSGRANFGDRPNARQDAKVNDNSAKTKTNSSQFKITPRTTRQSPFNQPRVSPSPSSSSLRRPSSNSADRQIDRRSFSSSARVKTQGSTPAFRSSRGSDNAAPAFRSQGHGSSQVGSSSRVNSSSRINSSSRANSSPQIKSSSRNNSSSRINSSSRVNSSPRISSSSRSSGHASSSRSKSNSGRSGKSKRDKD